MAASTRFGSGAVAPGDFLRKLEEVKESVKVPRAAADSAPQQNPSAFFFTKFGHF